MDYLSIFLLFFFLVFVLIVLCFFLFKRKEANNDTLSFLKDSANQIAPEFDGSIQLTTESSHCVDKKRIFIQDSHSRDTLLLMLLHELAHCLIRDLGHDQPFQTKFLELIERSRMLCYLTNIQNVFEELGGKKSRKYRAIPRRSV